MGGGGGKGSGKFDAPDKKNMIQINLSDFPSSGSLKVNIGEMEDPRMRKDSFV